MQSHRSTLYITLLAIAFVIVFVIGFTTAAKDMLTTERQQTDQRHTATENAVQALADALQTHEEEHREEIRELLRIISELQSEIEERTFMPDPDIPLSVELQLHTFEVGEAYGIPDGILLAIMWHESGFNPDVRGFNRNGTYDSGLMQINSVNHAWLKEDHGLDVNVPEDNIEAAALILGMFLDKYPLEMALAAYAVGESGMLSGGGVWFAEEIFEGFT